jgi:hypothetical protein
MTLLPFHTYLSDEPVAPATRARPIRRLEKATTLPAARPEAGGGGDGRCALGDERRCSRFAVALPHGRWRLDREAEIAASLHVRGVLVGGGPRAAIVEGWGGWQLFDADLAGVAAGPRFWSGILVDAERGCFWMGEEDGLLAARSLEGGRVALHLEPCLRTPFERVLLLRRGTSLLLASTERYLNEEADPPSTTTLELYDLGAPGSEGEVGVVPSSSVRADLVRDSNVFLPAAGGDRVIAAVEDGLVALSLDLRVLSVFSTAEGALVPAALSLDELGNAYLLANTEDGRSLWVVDPDGGIRFSAVLPVELADLEAPPIVGRDHRVVVAAGDVLFAFAQGGEPLFELAAPESGLGGAVVTGDDKLLVASGAEVGVVDADGRFEVLLAVPAGPIVAPPALAADGSLLVATEGKLCRFRCA